MDILPSELLHTYTHIPITNIYTYTQTSKFKKTPWVPEWTRSL